MSGARAEETNGDWSVYSKVKHRLQLLDSPDPNGWTAEELAAEYGTTKRWMQNVLKRLVDDGYALRTRSGRLMGSGKTGVGQ